VNKLSDEQFYFLLSATLLNVMFTLLVLVILEGLPS
jgi:hypothetical protein